jgi:hypothetical protein
MACRKASRSGFRHLKHEMPETIGLPTPSGLLGSHALVREVEKAAAKSGAPFLAANAPLAEVRARWSQAFAP